MTVPEVRPPSAVREESPFPTPPRVRVVADADRVPEAVALVQKETAMKQVTIRRCPVCPSIGSHASAVVAELKRDPDLNVKVVDGAKGAFTVEVDGRTVSKLTGEMMPTVEEVVTAVRGG